MNALAQSPVFWVGLITGLALLYILPTLIGIARKVEDLGLLIFINLLPTGVGWIAALVMAFMLPRREPVMYQPMPYPARSIHWPAGPVPTGRVPPGPVPPGFLRDMVRASGRPVPLALALWMAGAEPRWPMWLRISYQILPGGCRPSGCCSPRPGRSGSASAWGRRPERTGHRVRQFAGRAEGNACASSCYRLVLARFARLPGLRGRIAAGSALPGAVCGGCGKLVPASQGARSPAARSGGS